DELEGDGLLEGAVGAASAVDHAHPPAPGLADDPVRSYQRAGREVVGPRSVPVGQQRRGEGGEGLAEGVGGLAGAGEEGEGLGVEGGGAAAGGAEVGRTGGGLAGDGLLDEVAEAAPAVGAEVVHGGGG